MPTTLPVELSIFLGSIVLVLVGWIWRNLDGRVSDIEDHHASMPLASLREDLAAIKKDIEWIKDIFTKKQ